MILDGWFWVACLGGAALFWAVPAQRRPWVVTAVTLAYLLTVSRSTVIIALAQGLLAFYAGPAAARSDRARAWTVRGITVLYLATLAFWKYAPELARTSDPHSWMARMALPLGISFYTFRLIHYLLEVSRRTLKPHRLEEFLAYLFFLPIFVAGPIEQWEHFQSNRSDRLTFADVTEGATRIVHGLIKKLLLAEAYVHPRDVDAFLGSDALRHPALVWRFLILWYVYAYLDFSGYSDLAIGVGRFYGVRLTENFRWPVLAASVSDFWKRWHISLAGWTQRYVYMPIIGRFRNPYVAVFATFFTLALWHAATWNYLAWGAFHAIGVATALTWARIKRVRRWGTKKQPGVLGYWSVPVTFLFITLSCAFSSTTGHGFGAAVSVFRGALGLL